MIITIIQNIDADGIKSIATIREVSVAGVLILFIAYLIWQNYLLKKESKEKDKRIESIIDRHLEDSKEINKDWQSLTERLQMIMVELKNELRYIKK